MSLRPRVVDAPVAPRTRLQQVLQAGLNGSTSVAYGSRRPADLPTAATGVTYDETPSIQGTYVFVKARGDEIVEAMMVALPVIRRNVAGKRIGIDSDAITIKSIDTNFTFHIMVIVDHGGKTFIINGNVGGVYKEHKITSASAQNNDYWIARKTADWFKDAGGKANDMVQIDYDDKR